MAEIATIMSEGTGNESCWPDSPESTGASWAVSSPGSALRSATASLLLATIFSNPGTTVAIGVPDDVALDLNRATTAWAGLDVSIVRTPVTSSPGFLLAFIRSVFGLNMSESARVLQVERPTVYSWLKSTAHPRSANLDRLLVLHALASNYTELSAPVAQLVGVQRSALLDVLEHANPTRDQIDRLLRENTQRAQRASVRAWADRRSISLDALRNPDGEVPDRALAVDADE